MPLFNFKKKKKLEKEQSCCGCDCETRLLQPIAKKVGNELHNIKVLGAGCGSCHEQLKYVKEAVKNMGLDIEIEYITDLQKVMEYGVMHVPALVVNENVVSMGKVLKTAEIQILLQQLDFCDNPT
ncbi:MAG: thioredoxin family protein [Oscillospiraceae bacterium]|nr:thioredoxin family protein [Oscillospiraceae bacterium]